MPVRAVMFDFNGTLSHDEPVLLAIYQRLFARHGRPLTADEYYAHLAGLSDEAIIGSWLGVDGPLLGSLIDERVAAYAAEADGSTVAPATREAVRLAAARVPVAVVSAAFRAEVEPVVAAAGLADAFTAIVCADDVEHIKPDPEAYLRAAAALAVEPADAVALEDTPTGVAAAKDAGLRCVAVRGTVADERLSRADELVDAIDPALLERLLEDG